MDVHLKARSALIALVTLAAVLPSMAAPSFAADALNGGPRILASIASCTDNDDKPDPVHGYIQTSAVIDPAGTALALQCSDGRIFVYDSKTGKAKPATDATLFLAAQRVGLLPTSLSCSWLGSYQPPEPADCFPKDDVGETYFVAQGSGGWSVRSTGSPPLLAHSGPAGEGLNVTGGILWPRAYPQELIIVDDDEEPEMLRTIRIGGEPGRKIRPLPMRNLLFENGEGRADSLHYAPAKNLIIIAFDGVFRVSQDMAFVRAFSPEGEERWSIRGPLPQRNKELIVGDGAKLAVLAGGRYATWSKSSRPYRSEVIELDRGQSVASLNGAIVGAAREGTLVVLRRSSRRVDIVELDGVLPR